MKYSIWLLISILTCFIFPVTVLGHASVISSNPSPNEKVETLPETISIQFSEEIQPSFYSLKVISKNREEIPLRNIQTADKTLEASWSSPLQEGSYILKWRVVSSDGHPIKGVIPFQFGESKGQVNPWETDEQASRFPGSMQVGLQSLLYIGFATLMGVSFFYLLLLKDPLPDSLTMRVRRYIWLSYVGISLAVLLSLPLKVTIDAQVDWPHAFRLSYFKEVLQSTQFGRIWEIEVILLLLLFFVIVSMMRKELKRVPFGLAAILVSSLMACKAFTGHTNDVKHHYLAVAMDFLHLLSMSLWLGGLLAILVIVPKSFHPRRIKDQVFDHSVIQRFSSWALLFVIVLILSGLYSSFQHIPTLYSLVHTTYGQLLLGKIGLMVIMMGLGARHLLSIKRKRNKLGLSMGIEFGVGIVVLLIAALLTNVQTAASSPGPLEKTQYTKDGSQVALSVTPNEIGENEILVELKNNEGVPYRNIEQLTLTMLPLESDVGELTWHLHEESNGRFRAKTVIAMAGKWDIHVHALTKDLESIDADFSIVVGHKTEGNFTHEK